MGRGGSALVVLLLVVVLIVLMWVGMASLYWTCSRCSFCILLFTSGWQVCWHEGRKKKRGTVEE
jgi:ABC-type nickel/cobalt efflux system permease component RcnA